MDAELKYIGSIGTPYKTLSDCPRNVRPDGPICTITVNEDYIEGLTGLVPEQQILILYWFDKAKRTPMIQRPGNNPDADPRGTFALRSPHRPNPIAAAVLPIVEISGNVITVRGLDCLDGTNLLDIKPAIGFEKR
ncbi:tRNA (N6-threonylcarbamoyladenosine(37)-N6)-methyltransferase TrmO [uncultured Cohaesibacter sp.]|uniref:tRNA (N6-threonylcarbamoyladenosine(37)-N6)-methyltransferase TrmO n=1 Tax=uncultured Cohaesibacter sp. TaxID=1002546 RepID=UPI00292D8E15|nr:tRNA (N6-threonylcarbamoyladenosine(37)-N6)-methyltransferase TrmO [uncultured Cohaesibacter sp.]